MEKRIIYMKDGVLCIVSPCLHETNPDTGNLYTAEEVAVKDVPKGLKYKIVNDTDIPYSERPFRMAWTVDESVLTDGTGTWELT